MPVDKNSVQAKVDEFEKLQRDLKFKQEDAKARYGRREEAVVGPIVNDVGVAIMEFAKQRGFTLVLDLGKMMEQRIVLFADGTPDITVEFIQFYNARPALGAAKP